VGVVDGLEVIEVGEHDREGGAVACGAADLSRCAPLQAGHVQQPGLRVRQRVGLGLPVPG
jgi:hypothetical protein